jgi:hypothetical protein
VPDDITPHLNAIIVLLSLLVGIGFYELVRGSSVRFGAAIIFPLLFAAVLLLVSFLVRNVSRGGED